MSRNEITGPPRKLVYAIAIGAVLLGIIISVSVRKSQRPSIDASVQSDNLATGSAEKFALLSGQSGQRSVGST